MYLIEKISNSIALKVSSSLQLGEEQRSIIAYGAISLIQLIYSLTLAVIVGLSFGVLNETLLVLFTESLLRKYSGGIHSHSPNRCAVIGMIFSVGLGLMSKHLSLEYDVTLIAGILIFSWAFIILHKLAPVDSPAKPIKQEKKRLRLKKYSLFALSCLMIVSAILIIVFKLNVVIEAQKYIFCIYLGIIWQVFSLTKLGHAVMGKVDAFLDIKYYKGGRTK